MAVIAVWSPFDLVLSTLMPLGLAVHAGTALVVDLDPVRGMLHSEENLASLVRNGPTEAQLSPRRRGVAVLANGGIAPSDAADVIGALASRWPNVVLRCAPAAPASRTAVGVVPLLPGPYGVDLDGKVVYQRTTLGGEPQRGAPVLPAPRPATVRALLTGRLPARRDRWIRSLDTVWSMA